MGAPRGRRSPSAVLVSVGGSFGPKFLLGQGSLNPNNTSYTAVGCSIGCSQSFFDPEHPPNLHSFPRRFFAAAIFRLSISSRVSTLGQKVSRNETRKKVGDLLLHGGRRCQVVKGKRGEFPDFSFCNTPPFFPRTFWFASLQNCLGIRAYLLWNGAGP